jgi:hypothetical protein
MTRNPAPGHDVLAVTIGPGGVRARRTGRSDAADSFVEVPDAPVAPGAASAAELVAAVLGLTERDARPPEAVVWAVPESWYGGPAVDVLAATRERCPDGRIAVVAYLFATHVGAFGAVRPGTCLEAGAGSAALATDLDQVWHRVDGWGFPLGSRGSGAWIGAQGLAAGLRWRDGVPAGSEALLHAGRAALGDEATWPALLAGADSDIALTSFAPAVAEAGHEDVIAREILRHAGEALAESLLAGRALLPGTPIVAVGGLLYLDAVRVALASALGQRQVFLVPGLGGALEGARLIGDHLLGGGALPHRPPYVVLDHPRAIGG